MPLPMLLDIPDDEKGWDSYWFSHHQDHLEIIAAIKSKKNVQLLTYAIYPWVPTDKEGILERHQQLHNDMNGALNNPGTDIGELDFKNPQEVKTWVWANFDDHRSARAQLGI